MKRHERRTHSHLLNSVSLSGDEEDRNTIMLTIVFLLELLKKVESKTVTFVIDAEYAV